MQQGAALVFIPTYNECENVEEICSQILALGLDLDILFLDDNSTDGTGTVLKSLAAKYPNVHVVFRTGKLGVGSAHLDGIRWAYDNGYEKLVTMDCDFTHSPSYLPSFFAYSDKYDVVVGSRYLLKDSLSDWSMFRRFLTHMGHFMTRYLLGIKYDATGAFRLYRLDHIPRRLFDVVRSKGYSFFFESLYVLQINSFRIAEFPIALPARTYGHSKMSMGEAFHSVKLLISLYIKVVSRKKQYLLALPTSGSKERPMPLSSQQWDKYWDKKYSSSGLVYDVISTFYRTFIIKPTVNYFIQKYFKPGQNLLHAGCGSGQTDIDINRKFSITALDISPCALSLYRKFNRDNPRVIHGDIFQIPFEDGSFDGAYNVGVLEHFSEAEIVQILSELRRVVKSGGKILVFWPPEFGLSVCFLKIAHVLLRIIFRRDVRLHPAEPTLLKSRHHIEAIGAKANLKVTNYYFGWRDCFTQAVIVLKKS